MKKWKEEEFEIGIKLIEEGKTFTEIAKELNRSFNSVRCYFNRRGYQTLTSVKYITCLECEGVFEKNECLDGVRKQREKFCSRHCSASFNKNGAKRKKETKKCLNCDNKCKTISAKYCCQNCQFEHQIKTLIEKVNKNDTKGLTERLIKKALIIIHGEKCMKCGWNERNEKTGKVPIELNHKDGNSQNNDNENTELICPNCHSLTPNYKALNKGKGRHKRRQRAREGKSY